METDQAGKRRDELLPRLANRFFVRVAHLPDRAKPDTVPEQFLLEVLAIAAHRERHKIAARRFLSKGAPRRSSI